LVSHQGRSAEIMMTKEEFRKIFEEEPNFWFWVGPRRTSEASYWLSLKEYAEIKFNEAYNKENYPTRG